MLQYRRIAGTTALAKMLGALLSPTRVWLDVLAPEITVVMTYDPSLKRNKRREWRVDKKAR
jgi:hypothetical protein